mgnify:CR=1 FL=1
MGDGTPAARPSQRICPSGKTRRLIAPKSARRALCRRITTRVAFGKTIAEHSVWEQRIAEARTDIEMNRLLCLKAAYMMDVAGNKVAKNEIAMIKLSAPRMALKIIDDAIQAHGGAGVCQDFGLAKSYAGIRTLRLADGPDEVHARSIAMQELGKYGWTGKRSKDDGVSLPGMR